MTTGLLLFSEFCFAYLSFSFHYWYDFEILFWPSFPSYPANCVLCVLFFRSILLQERYSVSCSMNLRTEVGCLCGLLLPYSQCCFLCSDSMTSEVCYSSASIIFPASFEINRKTVSTCFWIFQLLHLRIRIIYLSFLSILVRGTVARESTCTSFGSSPGITKAGRIFVVYHGWKTCECWAMSFCYSCLSFDSLAHRNIQTNTFVMHVCTKLSFFNFFF